MGLTPTAIPRRNCADPAQLPDAVAALRAEYDARIAQLERQVAELRAAQAPARADAALAAKLLPALAIAVGDDPFQADYIAETQDANLRYIVGRRSTGSVGLFLGRIKGLAFAGYMIVPAGKVYNRCQWRLRRVVSVG